MSRRRYEDRRAQAVYDAVWERVMDLRIRILHGEMECLNASGKDDFIYLSLMSGSDDIAAAAVRAYKQKGKR